ncbi:phospholipase B domain containing [Pycnococcus provasolii]|uniref:Phospholipase B-like n=1 Tax=Pycnococcus provasolii TaxID=41880 RepID=A0A830HWR5_9CHLO|nr:phospholipase B domain containing [Pycnococcus provasolii]
MRRGDGGDGDDGSSSVFQGDSFSFFEQLASSLHSHHVVSVGDVSFPSSSNNNKKKKQVSLVVRVKNTSGVGVGASCNYVDASHRPRGGFGALSVVADAPPNVAHDSDTSVAAAAAAGMCEGQLTAKRISNHAQNVFAMWKDSGIHLPDVYAWLDQQRTWIEAQIANKHDDDHSRFWDGVKHVHAQFVGMAAGYKKAAEADPSLRALNQTELYALNAAGDIIDLANVLKGEPVPKYDDMNPDELRVELGRAGHCSALIRPTGDLKDIVFGHTAWYGYQTMTRIYKHYDFSKAPAPSAVRPRSSFSSYPGYLSSLDDFYLMKEAPAQGEDEDGPAPLKGTMAMIQTTNNVFNKTLYQEGVRPESVLAWQRVRVANSIAENGQGWGDVIATHNSGTYNNQYMVLDLSLFQPGSALEPGLLTIVEQVPTLVVTGDATRELELSHFPSYNVPYWRKIYDISGYPQFVDSQRARGQDFASAVEGLNYQLAPRAKIFRRDAGNVHDLDGLKAILRYNDFKHDPYSGGSPFGAICSRGDLGKNPVPDGCLDGKVSAASIAGDMVAYAVNGPTQGGTGALPPFAWSQFQDKEHVGMPDDYKFDWEEQKPDPPAPRVETERAGPRRAAPGASRAGVMEM